MDDPLFPFIRLTNSEGITVRVGHCEICGALVAAYDEENHRSWHAAINAAIQDPQNMQTL